MVYNVYDNMKLIKCPVCKHKNAYLYDEQGKLVEIDKKMRVSFNLKHADKQNKCSICKRMIKYKTYPLCISPKGCKNTSSCTLTKGGLQQKGE